MGIRPPPRAWTDTCESITFPRTRHGPVMKCQTNVMRGYFWIVILSIWISIIIYMSWTSLVCQMKEMSCAVIFEEFADASTRCVVQYRWYLYWANGAWYGSLEYHSSNPHSPWVLSIEPPCIDFLVAFLCKSARSIVLAGKWNMTKTSSPPVVVRFHLTINSSSIAVLMSVQNNWSWTSWKTS